MSLRRFAQHNNNIQSSSGEESPQRPPRTPRSSNIYRSPVTSPSLSSTTAFDWEAARSYRPTPSTPLNARSKVNRSSLGTPRTPGRKAVVRRPSLVDQVLSFPSNFLFHLSMFPYNVPFPPPRTSAWILGGFFHLVHCYTRMHQGSADSDVNWYQETTWIDWTGVVTFLLLGASILNGAYLFTRIKLYRMHRQPDLVASPNSRFVESQLDLEPSEPTPILTQFAFFTVKALSVSWRFLLGMPRPQLNAKIGNARVQQMEVWNPGELEIFLFCIYSPVHSLLWVATNSSNWIIMFIIMGLLGTQLNVLCTSFKILLKDKEIISSEVFNEYNQIFVNPRVNPLRSDAAVMTHESEVVDVWN